MPLVLLLAAPADGASGASLTVKVSAQVRPGSDYTITVNGSFGPSEVNGAGYLISLIQFSADPCAGTAQLENPAVSNLPVQFYFAPKSAPQEVGISLTNSPFTRTDTLTAGRSGVRHVCAYLYPQQIGASDTTQSIATADVSYTVLNAGGNGRISPGGRVGPMRID
jgi:hypothetical protein